MVLSFVLSAKACFPVSCLTFEQAWHVTCNNYMIFLYDEVLENK